MLGGELIYQTSDNYGSIEVVDYLNELRALHFGNATQQSACLICNPDFLVHKYAQAMLLPFCWLKPKRVLVLGLGAGSIVKYLHHYHPEIQIDTVELRSKVIEVASEFFHLPAPNSRLNIYNDSAQNWLCHSSTQNYDLIIVDIFLANEDGKDITVDLSDTMQLIYHKLSSNGIAVFNQLGENIDLSPELTQFSQPIYKLNIDSTNLITFASRRPIPKQIAPENYLSLAKISTVPYQLNFDLLQKTNS